MGTFFSITIYSIGMMVLIGSIALACTFVGNVLVQEAPEKHDHH